MWPQKWKASASPGLTALATTPPAVPTTSARPTRASRPRRDVRAARPSANAPRSVHPPRLLAPLLARRAPTSGMRRLQRTALRGGKHALELRQAVERPLGQHDAGERVERGGVRAAGHPRRGPGVGVAMLVEDLDGE